MFGNVRDRGGVRWMLRTVSEMVGAFRKETLT